MKRFLKFILILVVAIGGFNLWSYWIFPTFFPEAHATWQSNVAEHEKGKEEDAAKDKRLGDVKRAAEDKIRKEKADAKEAVELAKIAAEKAKLESPSYKRGEKAGWDAGLRLGWADAKVKRKIRGVWAQDCAQRAMEGYKDDVYAEAYVKACRSAYYEGWHQVKNIRDQYED